jgi:hypothetical protein
MRFCPVPESPGEAELLDRVLGEDPRHRVARRAYERWLTLARLRATLERLGLEGREARIRFICASLWPTMPGEHLEEVVRRALSDPGSGLDELPSRIEDVVNPVELELLVAFGYLPPVAGTA